MSLEPHNPDAAPGSGAAAAGGARGAVALDRDALILAHVPLLRHIVGRMTIDVPAGMDRDDMFGFGMLGLIAAADSWEPSRGLQFSTYAYTKIRGAILDELRRADFLPRGRRERVRDLDRAVVGLEQEHGVAPSIAQIAERMSTSEEEVDAILLSARSSGHASLDDGPSAALCEMLSDPRSSDPVGSAEWNEMKGLLVTAIQRLPEQEQVVITLYYGEELLLREISAVLGLTESRVSQIHTRGLYLLNRFLSQATDEAAA